MRILVTAAACIPGAGSEPGVGWNWVRQLARRHEVWIVTLEASRERIEAALEHEERRERMHFHYTHTPRLWRVGWMRSSIMVQNYCMYLWMYTALRLARRLHREQDFDLALHLTVCTWRLPPQLYRLGIPFVWGPMGGGEAIPWKLRRVLDWRGRIGEAVRDLFQIISRFDPLVRRSMRRATRLLAVNADTGGLIRRYFSREAELFPVVGIEEEGLLPSREHRGGGLTLVCAGKFQPRKAFILALEALARARKLTGERLRLVLVGDGRERGRLERRAAELGLDGRELTITGMLERDQALEAITAADVFLFPSLRDSGGMVLLEAMSAGLPVICLDLGGPGEIVTAECGIKVAPGSPEQVVEGLAAAIVRLAGDAPLRAGMGEAGRRRVLEHYRWRSKGERIEALLREVADGGIPGTVAGSGVLVQEG